MLECTLFSLLIFISMPTYTENESDLGVYRYTESIGEFFERQDYVDSDSSYVPYIS